MDLYIQQLAEEIWQYHLMNHKLVSADAIIVLCSHDELVATRGAELFLGGWAPLLIFSGGQGAITKQLWIEAEADRFARIAERMGVPPENILIENRSSNTGENIRFTRKLLEEKGLNLNSLIVVQKPYMERRSYATFKKLWPEPNIVVTSPQVTFEGYLKNYANQQLSQDDVVGIMVGDLQRIKLYPAKGFQIEQDIPSSVWTAYEALVAAGYDKHLIR